MTERSTDETLAALAAEELHAALHGRGFPVDHVGMDGAHVVATFQKGPTLMGLLYLLEDLDAQYTLDKRNGLRQITMNYRVAMALTAELNR